MEQVFLRKLRHARTPKELHEVQKEHDELDQNKRICDFQLKQNGVPWACYARLRIEQRWGLIDKAQVQEWETKLNDRCESAAKAALHQNAESLRLPIASLSQECRHMVQQARDISHYRSNEIFSRTTGAEFEDAPSP